MLHLDDPRWQELCGGYGTSYDASIALRALRSGTDVWEELWEELHHQGDIGEASYAAVPHLVDIAGAAPKRDWNFYGLIACIEVERHRKGNPSMPTWLHASYDQAWMGALKLAVTDLAGSNDSVTFRAILSVIALGKGELNLGAMLSVLDSSEVDEWLDERQDWSDTYG